MTDLAPLNWVRTPSVVFGQTCDGPVSSWEVAALRHGQYSHRKLLLRTFAEVVEAVRDELGPFRMDRAWELLDAAERKSPEAVDEVVMYPSVGIWLSRVLRQVLGRRLDDTPLWSEVGGFQALAAAVAVRSGLEFEINVPVVHGVVALPSVGVLRAEGPAEHAVLRCGRDGFELTIAGEVQRPRLEAVRHHVSEAGGRALRMVLDDLDPYREFGAPLAPGPLAERERDEWFRQMDGAWELLAARHPAFADELSACLASVVPLAGQDMFAVSSSAAFGSVAMSPKGSALEFAEALTHEIQHSKVNALLDLVVLCQDGEDCRFYVPWLDYPRGVTGLLHGVYAFCSVVEYWFVERDFVGPELLRRARFNFFYRRHQVARVLSYLGQLPELTDLGREFVAGVSARLEACPATDLPGDLVQDVERLNTDHHVLWRLRHVRPDKRKAEALADAWLAGKPCDQDFCSAVVVVSPESGRSPLGTLLKARALEGRAVAATDAEDAFLAGDLGRAATLFVARLEASPEDLTAWSGLALASGSATLLQRPEVVHAVHHALALRDGPKPDPLALAEWFDQTSS